MKVLHVEVEERLDLPGGQYVGSYALNQREARGAVLKAVLVFDDRTDRGYRPSDRVEEDLRLGVELAYGITEPIEAAVGLLARGTRDPLLRPLDAGRPPAPDRDYRRVPHIGLEDVVRVLHGQVGTKLREMKDELALARSEISELKRTNARLYDEWQRAHGAFFAARSDG